MRLIDIPTADENRHLDFVLTEAVRAIESFRAQGRTVLLHCVGAYSRKPTVGALCGARLRGVNSEEALADVLESCPARIPITYSVKRCSA